MELNLWLGEQIGPKDVNRQEFGVDLAPYTRSAFEEGSVTQSFRLHDVRYAHAYFSSEMWPLTPHVTR